jgi:hypothetical protein
VRATGNLKRTLLAALVVCLLSPVALAQRDLPPIKGGTTYSLGMPPVYKGRSGFELQWYRAKTLKDLGVYYNLGLSRDLGSPVVGIGALRAEGYIGGRGHEFDGGGRALLEIPSFHLGFGADFNGSDSEWDFLFQLDLPLRRGGIFGRGTSLCVRWLPSRDQTIGLGVNVPLWGRNIGQTRPKSDNVRLDDRDPYRLELEVAEGRYKSALQEISERARWVADLSIPFAEPEGAEAAKAMEPVLAHVRAHVDSTDAMFPAGHTLNQEIEAYHRTLDLAFSLALGDQGISPRGMEISARAREILLDDVLLPYNYLLGQRKKNDSLVGMIAIAQTEFASWALRNVDADDQTAREVFFVYQTLCDVMEENRARLLDRWRDSRFVWLPLHFALKPEQHDSQAELDDLISRAVDQPFTQGNRLWYVINEQFQWEMVRSVRKAEDYHVLWIHDFRGKNGQGNPDAIAYAQTLNYLEAMIERVNAYDEKGRLPQYFIMLDQHYFEINKARLWLRLLSSPLDYELGLPKGYEDWEERIKDSQQRLRDAIAGSQLLSVATSQYGEDWLKNRIKVHVNITNPADPSFFSWHSVGIIPIPDNMMRDHRKIAFYDVTEDDPYKGKAMFTGMGIGEHYVGANWEDRAIMIQGPGALAVKDACRDLMLAQGFEAGDIPYPLRKLEKTAAYDKAIAADIKARGQDWMDNRGSAIQLHNETGFHDKPINVAKAVMYSMMPAGSVLKVPDSLWQSYVYASLLAGSAQRGCKVMIIAPTLDSAPSNAPPTLARAHGLLGRLIVFSNAMDDLLDEEGGLLKVGLYAPRQGVGDIAGRFEQAFNTTPEWVRRIYPPNPHVEVRAPEVAAILDSVGYEVQYLSDEGEDIKPKIHLKANFMASGTAWQKLLVRPEFDEIMTGYVEYLADQSGEAGSNLEGPDVKAFPPRLKDGWNRLFKGMISDLSASEKEEIIFYFSVGSTNMDYRSMVMDGEVQITLGGWQSLYGFLDFLMLPGLCEWVDTTEELDALLPPPSGMVRAMAGLMKLTL